MSKWTAEQLKNLASKLADDWTQRDDLHKVRNEASDALDEYAAHLAAQAEWPSEVVERAEHIWMATDGTFTERMRAALQSVRPTFGTVSGIYPSEYSDDRLRRIIDPECGYDYEARSLANAWLASRHAHTKE